MSIFYGWRTVQAGEPGTPRFCQWLPVQCGDGRQRIGFTAAVWADSHVGVLRPAVDIDQGGQSTAPIHIRLQYGVQAIVQKVLKAL